MLISEPMSSAPSDSQRIAIIGSGISGLVCAHLLRQTHDVTIFEANDYVGGHTHTVSVALDGESYDIDTGFIVFNDRNYPNFRALLDSIDVGSVPTTMSFSVHCERSGLEYNGSSLNGLFAQRRNLLRPSFHRMIKDILRFNREAPEFLDDVADEMTVGQFIRERGYGREFAGSYLLPMGAAIWSCPMEAFEQFPIRFIIEFYSNHGLLQIRDRPVWHVVEGGSKQYVERLTAPFRDRIRLNCPVVKVARDDDGVTISPRGLPPERFDEVIFACHSDQALQMLSDADQRERSVLEAFPYGQNTAILHTDTAVLPDRRRAWASWNYRLKKQPTDRPAVTYNMNILQHIRSQHTFCVTLNDEQQIRPDTVLGRFQYAHPVFTTARAAAQRRHAEVIRGRRASFCGAYWGNGFHEDGVNSAIAVCRAFGIDFHSAIEQAASAAEGISA